MTEFDRDISQESAADFKATPPIAPVVELVKETGPEPGDEPYEPRLLVFREVPGFDPRTLVLSYGEEEALDLQFCSCQNKYKKRFSSFLKENPEFLADIKAAAVALAEQGYRDVDIKDILEYLRGKAKIETSASEYLQQYPHDFTFDVLPRAYLVRKLMMDEPKLFKFFELTPVKCKSQCGYGHSDVPVPDEDEDVDIAGF